MWHQIILSQCIYVKYIYIHTEKYPKLLCFDKPTHFIAQESRGFILAFFLLRG